MKILVVEDDDALRALIERGLRKANFEVQCSASVDAAIQWLDSTSFAVAIVDLTLIDQSGLVIVRDLVRRVAKTKVIIYTAHASVESALEGIELGVYAYVEKSRGLSFLIDAVNRASTAYLKESLSQAEDDSRLQVRLLDAVQVGVIAVDLNEKIIFANRFAQETLGYLGDEMLDKKVRTFLPISETIPDLSAVQTWEAQVARVSGPSQEPHTHPQNSILIQTKTFPILDSEEKRIGDVIVFSDITQQRKSEQELDDARQIANHAQRVSIIGQMAGVLAHEINQPLGAICNYSGGLLMGLEMSSMTTEQMAETLVKIQQQAKRASEIVSQLRHFVAKSTKSRSVLDMHQILNESIELLECQTKELDGQFKLRFDAPTALVFGDQVQLTQVLVNVLRNAVEAVYLANSEDREINVSTRIAEGNVMIEVLDHGPGFNPEIASHIFEPYYTTKPGGMGLGLCISKSIVENHGGTMSVENAPNSGVLVQMSLPRSDNAPQRALVRTA